MKARHRDAVSVAWTALVVIVVPLLAGLMLTATTEPELSSRSFAWLLARAVGIAAFLCLFGLCALGIWMRHPWRLWLSGSHAESLLRVHATLGVACIVLVTLHVELLATDRYAGVGWAGALVPTLSHYRRTGVSLGVLSLYALVAIALTARFAGAPFARRWRSVHLLAIPCFLASLFHGVMSGTDVAALEWMYAATALCVGALVATRILAGPAPARKATEVRA